MNIAATLQSDITPECDDYTTVRRVIEMITEDYREQPGLEDLAGRLAPVLADLYEAERRRAWAAADDEAEEDEEELGGTD